MAFRFKDYVIIVLVLFANASKAAIDAGEVETTDFLSQLKDEVLILQKIEMGLTLSLAQCESVNPCVLKTNEDEIGELIYILNERIDGPMLKQGTHTSPELKQILTTFLNIRDNYLLHLQKLKSLGGSDLQTDPVFSPLLKYLDELQFFEDEKLEDDETADEWSFGLPDIEEKYSEDKTP